MDPVTYQPDILLGTIIKVFGFEGAVTVRLEKPFIEKIPEMESVFIEIDGKPVPFFISGYEYNGGNTLRLKFTGYNSPDRVLEFTGCSIFLTSTGRACEKSGELAGFKNFTVILPDSDQLGRVIDIIDNPGQSLLCLETKENKELLIPFHEDLIISIDRKKHILIMDLPEGLTDLN